MEENQEVDVNETDDSNDGVLTSVVDINAQVRKFGEPKQEVRFMEEGDRLKAENLQLQVMNLALQERELLRTISDLRDKMNEAQGRLLAHRSEMGAKYKIDFERMEVRAGDGAILPKGSTPQGHIR